MAELIGLIASIAGLAELTINVSFQSVNFVQNIRYAPKAILALSEEAKNLHSLLKHLEESLKDVEKSGQRVPITSIQDVSSVLVRCKSTLEVVQRKLKTFANPDLLDRVKFVFAEKSIAKLNLTIEGHKATLVVAWLGLVHATGLDTNFNTRIIKENVDKILAKFDAGPQTPPAAMISPSDSGKQNTEPVPLPDEIISSNQSDPGIEAIAVAEARELEDMVASAAGAIRDYLKRSETHQVLGGTTGQSALPEVVHVTSGSTPPSGSTTEPETTMPSKMPSIEAQTRTAQSLITAAAAGKLKVVQKLAKSVRTLDTVRPNLGTALQAAIANGHLEVARELLELKADPNICGDGLDALPHTTVLAVNSKNQDLLQCLLEHGANPTPGLIPAVQQDNMSFVKQLLEKGGKPKKDTTLWEGTALNIAIAHGCNDIAALLLDHKADPDLQGSVNSKPPVQTAVIKRNFDGLIMLKERGANLDQTTFYGNALISAVVAKDEDAVKLLLNLGANVNQAGWGSGTPLNVAIRMGDNDMARLLLSKKADPNLQGDLNALMPLQTAVRSDNLQGAKLLMEHGTDPNVSSIACKSALEMAMNDDEKEDMVDILLGQ